jgi:hypothetical protein
MLPAIYSDNILSLLENNKRVALSVIYTFDANFKLENYRIKECNVLNLKNYTYEEFDSRGSAGGGESAVDGQLAGMHSVNSGEPKLVYYFNKTMPKCFDSNGVKLSGGCKGTINIQQKFFKYGKKVK